MGNTAGVPSRGAFDACDTATHNPGGYYPSNMWSFRTGGHTPDG